LRCCSAASPVCTGKRGKRDHYLEAVGSSLSDWYLFHSNNLTLAGRIGVCLVFLFAALGHFFKTDSMILMLPQSVPARRAVIYVSGVFEILVAIGVASLPNPSYVGWMIVLYLIAIFLSNVYAAIHRIPFGGHSMGPRYLFARFPMQLLLVDSAHQN
jgi:uncharacterized membrane protein